MKPGFGEVLLAEGDPRIESEQELLIDEFRRQLDEGMWAAVPTTSPGNGRREALMVKTYRDIPEGAERVIFARDPADFDHHAGSTNARSASCGQSACMRCSPTRNAS